MAEIILYGVIGDPADKLDSATVTAAIRGSTGPLSVRINSPGGFVMEGLAIVEALRAYPDRVTIHIDGLAASMASVIAMVGDEIIIAESALMMIHKPWDSSIGNADDLRRDAEQLDRLERQLINIYAKRTSLPEGELAAMMRAETWLTSDEALAQGFVTTIGASLRIAAMARAAGFGFRNLPDRLKEQDMTTPSDATQAVAAERTRISTIMALCDKHRLPAAMSQELIARGTPLDQARATILDHLATEADRLRIGHSIHNSMTLDNPATYCDAIRDALTAKIAGREATGPAAEFRGMSVAAIARDFMERQGNREARRMTDDKAINLAMRPSGGRGNGWGMGGVAIGAPHTTSDFPELIGSSAEKFLVERYKLQESELKKLASVRTRTNFLMHYGVQMSSMGALDRVNEAGEFRNRSLTTRNEGYKIEPYGDMFTVSRQMLANDGLNALSDILIVMAAAAAETEAVVLAAIINAGYVMMDGKQLFHIDHKNLAAAGAPPSVASLDAGRLAMRSQRDLDGTGLIDARPKFLVVPVQLETAAETLVSSAVAPTTAADVNPFAGKLEVIADPRLTNSTAWYLFADPQFSPALQISYLDGQTVPFTDSQDGWRVDGTEYKVRHDFGAGVLDHRLAWKNPGA